MTPSPARFIAIVPAAGSGSRMGSARPKQYLPLAGRPLIWHTLASLLAVSRLALVCVVLSPEDEWWDEHDWSPLGKRLRVLRVGGATRAESVSNALAALAGEVMPEDWMLVHDAARACISVPQVEGMIDELADDPVGGLLAQPVADTLKRGDTSGRVTDTVSREAMWQAQTPQMFRHGLLSRALSVARAVTDEAGAIEALGLAPKLVASDATNFKITYAQDMALAELILRARAGGNAT